MPRYFFDFVDDDHVADDAEGHDLPSPDSAKDELLKALVEIYTFEPRDADHRRVSCTVRNDLGTAIYRASLSLDRLQR